MNKKQIENKISFLQLNLGHRVIANDMVMAWLTNQKMKWILCLQEPSLGKCGMSGIPKGYGAFWSESKVGNIDRPRAMVVLPKELEGYMISQMSNVDQVYVQIDKLNVCVASIYCPVERDMNETVKGIEKVREIKKNIIIGMDSNSYNTEWGSSQKALGNWRQRKRGEILYEALGELNMGICNNPPHIPTFVRKEDNINRGTSHIDITACTLEIYDKIIEWKVHETKFMTDHNCIVFQFVQKRQRSEGEERGNKQAGTGIPWKKPSKKMHTIICEKLEENVKYKNRINNKESVDKFIEVHGKEIRRVLEGIYNNKDKNRKNSVYWWTKEVEQAHKKLKIARRRMRKYRHKDMKVIFSECRGNFRKAVRIAKTESWKSFVMSIESLWEGLIKIVRVTERGRMQTRTLENLEGQYATDMKQTLMMLSSQFYPAPMEMLEFHKSIERRVELEMRQKYEEGKMITIHEIRYALTQVSMKSAPGLDKITNNVMYFLASTKFENMYVRLFNECIRLGYFPDTWKEALIVLIPKQYNIKNSVKSFRPISLTSVYAKLLERIILMRLQYYLNKTDRISNNQHAYIKGRSTQTALYEVFEVVQSAMRKKVEGVCMLVFLDISGAFDRTWHIGIINRLLEKKIPKYLIAIIYSFLSNRSALFSEGGCQHTAKLEQGCPQGGVLSPILWNILFDDMLKMNIWKGKKKGNIVKIVGYADDAALVCKAKTVEEASEIINVHLEKIYQWSIENRVQFNASKLAVLTIRNRKQISTQPAEVYYNKVLIKEVERYKYLGVLVDNKLSWRPQIENVIKNLDMVTKSLRGLNREEWGMKLKVFRMIYRAIFYPIMTYGIGIWGWRAVHKCTCALFDKEIRKYALVASKCLRSTSTVYLFKLINTQNFSDILKDEVLNVSVRQFHVLKTERQKEYLAYSKGITAREYPQCMDQFYMTCRKGIQNKCDEIEFDNVNNIYDVHPAKWIRNECVIENMNVAIKKGCERSGWNVYTDASSCSFGKGWGYIVYHQGFMVAKNYGSLVRGTVYIAEAFAVLQAIKYLRNCDNIVSSEKAEIRTDCLALVISLKKYVHKDELMHEINNELRIAQEEGKQIVIRWIPGHKGIIGNEEADKLAKISIDSRVVTSMRQTQSVISEEIKMRRKKSMINSWNNVESRNMRSFLPTMDDVERFAKSSPSAALCQLVAGHSRLNDFICKKWKMINSSLCKCGDSSETVTHFIFDCRLYDDVRKEVWPDFQDEYAYITKDWAKLQKYVNLTGRFRGSWNA